MLNALETVVYPNGSTRKLGDVATGSVSSIIDEVHANTSAITTINRQLSALVDDVNTNTSAITAINNTLSGYITDETVLYNENNWTISYVRFGNVVTVYILRPSTTTVDETLATLPADIRPTHDIGIRAYYGDAFAEVKANGQIRVKATEQWIQFCVSYVM